MDVQAAVAHDGESEFRIELVKLEAPRPDEILVRIQGVGLCHTDLVFRSGAVPYPFPAVFGHEGAGIVEVVGKQVGKVVVGDHVLLTFRSCGSCDRCDSGDAPYCRTMPALNYAGRRPDGSSALSQNGAPVSSNFFGQSSFATYAMTYERNVVKVDKALPLEIMGPIGCGVQTGAGAVMRSLAAQSGSSILITGGGSVGLSAVMGAKIQGCKEIILVEPHATRRAIGETFGATHTINPAAGDDFAEQVRAIAPAGVDFAIETSGVPNVQAAALSTLGSKGVLGIVGVSPTGTTPPGELNSLMTFGQSIKGIIEGDSDPDAFIPELLTHYKAGRLPFDKMIKTYPLKDINTAIADQHAGRCIKAVLIPEA